MLQGRPVTQLIVTHFHPDHAGNSGWICEQWGLRAAHVARRMARPPTLAMLNLNTDHMQPRATFYRRHGLDEARASSFLDGVVLYSDGVTLAAATTSGLRDGDVVDHRRATAGA